MSSPSFAGRTILPFVLASVVLAGCGGGGGSPGVGARPPSGGTPTPPVTNPLPPTTSAPATEADLNPGTLGDAFSTYWNMCAKPRTGVDFEGKPYPDRQGTLLDELKFLRAYTNQYYLWYNEIPNTYKMADFTDPVAYFNVLKTSALTPSGKAKDQYHFTYATDEWDKMQNAGIDLGYGVTWKRNSSTAPRT